MHCYPWALKPERERKQVSIGGVVKNADNCFRCSFMVLMGGAMAWVAGKSLVGFRFGIGDSR